ncbi:MAG: hypothetical protein ACFB9N_16945 [Geitlerinemataceae cyanobacterium]
MSTPSTPSSCEFANGNCASLHSIEQIDALPELVAKFGLDLPRPVLVIVGGAGNMSPETFERLGLLFKEVIAPFVDRLGAVVVDGGTDSGVMSLIGDARAASETSFPLVGVSAIGTIECPGIDNDNSDAATLEEHHTHFILVPGDDWGDESKWLAATATAIAGSQTSCTIVINGGSITWKDVANSVEAGRQTLVFDGSGRAADELAAELRDEPADDRAAPLVASGLLQAIDIEGDRDSLGERLATLLAIP